MEIEQAIFQTKPFTTAREKVLVNIIYTGNWVKGKHKAFFDQYGITPKQYNILRILKGAENPLSTAAIRDRMLDKMSDVSRIVDRMEKKGLVQKTECSKDLRKVDVIISKTALFLLDKMNEEFQTKQEDLVGLTEEESELLSNLLDKLRK